MTPKENETQMVHVRLSRYMYNGLEVLSAKLGMNISDLIRMGINNVLKKELTKKERNDLTDNELTNFLLMEYKKDNPNFNSNDNDSYNDNEDKKHDLIQQLRALEARNYDGAGTAESYEEYWRVKQRLARECGYVYDWDKMQDCEVGHDFYCSRLREKELNYLNDLANQYKQDKKHGKKIIEISEKEYLIFNSSDIRYQEEVNKYVDFIRVLADEALARLEYAEPPYKDAAGKEFLRFLDKISDLKEMLAAYYGVFYDIDKDPRVGLYNKDYPKKRIEKENKHLKKRINEYNNEFNQQLENIKHERNPEARKQMMMKSVDVDDVDLFERIDKIEKEIGGKKI
jgi:Arc/MetJ-type ribon-helix-helix transcriptional regulator